MLILYRKKGESILIGDQIHISVVESGADGVRLAIDAPKEITILRKELADAAEANKEAAKADVNAMSKIKELLDQKKI